MVTVNAFGKSGPEPAAMTKEALEKGADEVRVIVDSPTAAASVRDFLIGAGLRVQLQDDEGQLIVVGEKKKDAAADGPKGETPPPTAQEAKPLEGSPRREPHRAEEPTQTEGPHPKPQVPFRQPPMEGAPGSRRGKRSRSKQKKEPEAVPQKGQELAPPRDDTSLAVLITGDTFGRGSEELGGVLVKSFLKTLAGLETPPTVLALMNGGVKLALFDSSTCDRLKDLERRGTRVLVCGTCTNFYGVTDSVGVGIISNMYEIVETIARAGRILSL
ncbi:sulfurtransferase-like selenium metabolism protein YedF [Fretibacterium fastidiosum]|uniref:Selenium metabolism protein YedF n=1 Tax=Fretibacterium fastidiosum TaxID=651822 RepID=A0AB94IXE5_9BACT|nr:sulfurtransferase-like selenium metabolism protein YedF [Fretibacterium fastidiosum]CBL28408.1 selenium metabolism protein YedF [Fretibacterium fastidiosum]